MEPRNCGSKLLLAPQGQGLPLHDCAARSTRPGEAPASRDATCDPSEALTAALTAAVAEPLERQWEPLPPLLQPRACASAAVLNSDVRAARLESLESLASHVGVSERVVADSIDVD